MEECKFCDSNSSQEPTKYLLEGNIEVHIDSKDKMLYVSFDNRRVWEEGNVKINYCMVCGRKL